MINIRKPLLSTTLCISCMILAFPSLAQTNRCGVFEIHYSLENEKLSLQLETDCPDSATLMVSVDRAYEVNDGTVYGEFYLSEKSTVGEWKEPKIIDVSHENWKNSLEKTRERDSRLGMNYEIVSIEDNLKISMVIPIPVAKDLEGAAVKIDDYWGKPLVEDTKSIYFPLPEKDFVQGKIASLDPYSLDFETLYQISSKTPLMSELDPKEPLVALSKTIWLEPGARFKIVEVSNLHSARWYRVVVFTKKNKQTSLTGWINSVALVSQELQSIE